MVSSAAKTVEAYLAELPPERREVVAKVREVMRANLPEGYEETLNGGMITYEIPLSRYPNTYNKKPLMYAALAAQKNHYGIYFCNVYQDPALEEKLRAGYAAAGKKLDLGKSCVRFKRLEQVPLGVLGEMIAATPVEAFIAQHEAARAR